MAYKLSDKEKSLRRAVARLKARPDVQSRCLEYVREAVGQIGLKLPTRDEIIERYGHSTAIGCYHLLAEDPGRYGWVRVTTPLSHPIMLACYHDCGTMKADNGDTIVPGHIALLEAETGILRSSKDYHDGPGWMRRLVGLFVPA